MWEAVFFDFDGVVLDSVHVKTRAFARMFESYGSDIERQVVEYHLAHGGVSRYEKFRYYYKYLLGQDLTEEKLAQLGDQFAGLVVDEVLKAPFIEGVEETLGKLLDLKVPAFVVSGTPHEEILHIVKVRGVDRFFVEVHGAPRKKGQILKELREKFGYDLTKCLFIGDAMTDYDAAQEAGTEYLGIVTIGTDSPFPKGTKTSYKVTL